MGSEMCIRDSNNTFCEGDNVIFSAAGSGNWYQYLRVTGGVTSTVQSSTSTTYSSTSLSDQDTILVRNFTSSLTTCYREKSITVRRKITLLRSSSFISTSPKPFLTRDSPETRKMFGLYDSSLLELRLFSQSRHNHAPA